MSKSLAYDVLLHEDTLAKLRAYHQQIIDGQATPGCYLQKQLRSVSLDQISLEEFLQALLKTKLPCIFAESAIKGGGKDWNAEELSILGDISVSMAVKIYDNGVWSSHDPYFKTYTPPRRGVLVYTPGPLLTAGAGYTGILPDLEEATNAQGDIDQTKYNAMIERRLLPVFSQINNIAKAQPRPAFITIPGIGCGQFAGKFQGSMGTHLNLALQAMLKKHASNLPHISGIYYDPFQEGSDETHSFHHIKYLVRPALSNPGQAQLCDPKTLGNVDADLYKIVAWDHVSLPGNDFYRNSRATDDGVAAAATNTMEIMTGEKGNYNGQQYMPPKPYKYWEDVVTQTGTYLEVKKNVLVTKGSGQITPLFPKSGRAPRPKR